MLSFIYADSIENWTSNHTNFINAFDTIFNLFISIALFYVGWEANNIARVNKERTEQNKAEFKTRIQTDEREIFRNNYDKVTKALALIIQEGNVSNEAISLIWQARDQARLELPDDIKTFTEELKQTAQEAWTAKRRCWDEEGNVRSFKDRGEVLNAMHAANEALYDIRPHEVYRDHMAIKTSSDEK